MMLEAFPDAIPLKALIGGLMIGLSAAIMLLGLGRIAGVSGLAARAIGLGNNGIPKLDALIFVVGLPLGAMIASLLSKAEPIQFNGNIWMLVLGGLFVGYGTRLGSGCTSGHGVCGMSRLSPRSLIATITFMLAGVAMVAALRFSGLIAT